MEQRVETLRNAILSSRPPYCAGTLPLDPEDLVIFYGKDDPKTHGRIDFKNATNEQLQHLVEACDKATFGRNSEDVLDESYRKAGKLDYSQFCDRLDLERLGLVDAIRYNLLEENAGCKPIRIEPYKLNVYGKDSFFKSHRDTPRGTEMFGSLVIVFPTSHEGGALIIRHDSKEWTFDSGKEIGDTKNIGYVAFFSDVEHEVTPVKSGYRVTLTYNLYRAEEPVSKPVRALPMNEFAVKKALRALVEDETFHPQGVHLGFGLHHEYSIATKPEDMDTVEFIFRNLKGSDALLKTACEELGLRIRLFLCHAAGYKDDLIFDALVPNMTCFHKGDAFFEQSENLADWLISAEEEQWFIRRYTKDSTSEGDVLEIPEDMEDSEDSEYIDFPVAWIANKTLHNVQKAWWLTYAHAFNFYTETCDSYKTVYSDGRFCLIMSLGPTGHRSAGLPMQPKAKDFMQRLPRERFYATLSAQVREN